MYIHTHIYTYIYILHIYNIPYSILWEKSSVNPFS